MLARDDEPIAVASSTPSRVYWLQVRPAQGGDWRNIKPFADPVDAETALGEQRARSTPQWEFRVA